jgi:hypothetical protein
MRLANITLEEMTEALNLRWGERDSRVFMLLQEERAGVEIRVPEAAIRGARARHARRRPRVRQGVRRRRGYPIRGMKASRPRW